MTREEWNAHYAALMRATADLIERGEIDVTGIEHVVPMRKFQGGEERATPHLTYVTVHLRSLEHVQIPLLLVRATERLSGEPDIKVIRTRGNFS